MAISFKRCRPSYFELFPSNYFLLFNFNFLIFNLPTSILHIDTAASTANIFLARDGQVLAAKSNDQQKEHAGFVHVAIQQLMEETATSLQALDAIAVIVGPGSYTGIRIGMASAKGLCYALQKPFISINSLELLAFAYQQANPNNDKLICPLIDARRMDVFYGLYDTQLKPLIEPTNSTIDANFLADWRNNHSLIFLGDGAAKAQGILGDKHCFFALEPVDLVGSFAQLSHQHFANGQLANINEAAALYAKEFYTVPGKQAL
jgi:tRNA threonylcarbamoyladenosine biosynthesis protein TsaB